MRRKVSVGFIGTGHFTAGNHMPNCRDNPHIHVRALCRRNRKLLEEQAEEYNPDYIATNYRELLDDSKLDWVFIGTRSQDHTRFIAEAAAAGRNVFVEKPMATTAKDCKEIVKTVRSAGIKLMVGYNRRFAPSMVEAKRLFKRRRQPAMLLYRIVDDARLWPAWPFNPKIGGGKLMSECCHIFDLLAWFTESEPVRVHAEGWVRDDNVITVKFANGTIATIVSGGLGSVAYPKELFEIFVEHSTIVLDSFVELRADGIRGATDKTFPLLRDRHKKLVRGEGFASLRKKMQLFEKGITASQRKEGAYYDTQPIMDKGHYAELDAFAQAILKGQPSPVDEVEGARATVCCLKAIESLKTGTAKTIVPKDYWKK